MYKIHFAVVREKEVLDHAYYFTSDKRIGFKSLWPGFSSYREQIVFCILDIFKAHQFQSGLSYSVFLVDDDDPDNANKWIYLTYLNAYKLQRLNTTAKEIDKMLDFFGIYAIPGVDYGY